MRQITLRQITLGLTAAIPLVAVVVGGLYAGNVSHVPFGQPAGLAMMQLLQDEHALVAEYITQRTDAERMANATASAEIARARLAAIDAHRQTLADARSEPVMNSRTQRLPATAHTVARSDPLPVAPNVVPGAPLPLVQMASAQSAATARPREEGPVRARLRSLASDIKQVPRLFVSAADWMVDSIPRLPGLRRLDLPRREFSASL